MESIKMLPLMKQEFMQTPNLSLIQQLNQSLRLPQQLNLLGTQLPQPAFNQQIAMSANQRMLSQLLLQSPIIDGKVPVDPKFLQAVITQNEMMKTQINSLLAQREKLFQSLSLYEQKALSKHGKQMTLGLEKTDSEKKKRFRRSAKNISRMFQCPSEKCGKSYGSEGSLHQHIRLKHPEFDITTWIQSRLTDVERSQEANNQPSELQNAGSLEESVSYSSSENQGQEVLAK
eukprot:CAMPEP_0176414140 /NCGR_PEP_ID=MMETSP0127-20121128/5095_1 /TAXON_ID=938130 /ORGANISM="Platyophrya macrostoma, Strain WH" /LENGTH=230 /DNA_ID=CAMNT_0017794011 /DNA_START=50 /DNA_END=742 /DNA_ORIENTATION=-